MRIEDLRDGFTGAQLFQNEVNADARARNHRLAEQNLRFADDTELLFAVFPCLALLLLI